MKTLSEVLGTLIIRLYPKRHVAGTRVIFTDLDVDRDESAARIEQAIEVIGSSGEHYRKLLARVRFVVVWAGDYCFADGFGGVHLPSVDILGISTHALASVIVHEAVHIRINRMGIQYLPDYRERIENLCITAQATFLRCAPDNPDDAEDMARTAESVLASPWWTAAQREENIRQLLTDNRLPIWLLAVLRRQ